MRLLIVLLFLGVMSCQKTTPTSETPEPSKADRTDRTDTIKKTPRLVEGETIGPEVRIAAPHGVIAMRLARTKKAGTITLQDGSTRDLEGLGVNLCQTGYMIQGFYLQNKTLVSTPPFLIRLAKIPTGKPFVYRDPNVKKSALQLNLTEFGLDHAAGELTVIDTQTKTNKLKMVFDTEPTTVATALGIGPQGCYTTGYYHVGNQQGPVVAVWDGQERFYVGMQLNETQSLSVEFSMRGSQRRPENLIQSSLARVFAKPNRFPFRVNLETRSNKAAPGEETGPQLKVEKRPIENGRIMAVFQSSSAEGPIRIELADIEIPPGFGELSGHTVTFRTQALFVSDLKGRRVPVPIPPTWTTVVPELPNP